MGSQYQQEGDQDHMRHLQLHEKKVPYLPVDIYHMQCPTYIKMIFHVFSPHFTYSSLTFALMVITFLCLVVPQFTDTPSHYKNFMAKPSLPMFHLNIARIMSSPWNIYQCFTSLFFHHSYKHWLSNLTLMFLKMPPLEHVWWKCVPLMILAAFVAQCYVVLYLGFDNIGFNMVIAAGIGIYLGYLFSNCKYLMSHHKKNFYGWLVNTGVVFLMLIGKYFTKPVILAHLLSILVGLYYGVGVVPKYDIKNPCERGITISVLPMAIVVTLLPILWIVFQVGV